MSLTPSCNPGDWTTITNKINMKEIVREIVAKLNKCRRWGRNS